MSLRPTKEKTKQQKKLLQDLRRRERDNSGKRLVNARQKELDAAHQASSVARQNNDPDLIKARVTTRFANNLVSELRNRLSAAVAAEPALFVHRPPVNLSMSSLGSSEMGVDAYTDFKSIHITVDESRIPKPYGQPSDLKNFVMAIKGVFHHEAGHTTARGPSGICGAR